MFAAEDFSKENLLAFLRTKETVANLLARSCAEPRSSGALKRTAQIYVTHCISRYMVSGCICAFHAWNRDTLSTLHKPWYRRNRTAHTIIKLQGNLLL